MEWFIPIKPTVVLILVSDLNLRRLFSWLDHDDNNNNNNTTEGMMQENWWNVCWRGCGGLGAHIQFLVPCIICFSCVYTLYVKYHILRRNIRVGIRPLCEQGMPVVKKSAACMTVDCQSYSLPGAWLSTPASRSRLIFHAWRLAYDCRLSSLTFVGATGYSA